MTYTKEKTYSIGDAAEIIGATQRQLRNWEEQDYIPKLYRIICGDRHYRRFHLKDIEVAPVNQEVSGRRIYTSGGFRKSQSRYRKGDQL
jgi:hypothetical protein